MCIFCICVVISSPIFPLEIAVLIAISYFRGEFCGTIDTVNVYTLPPVAVEMKKRMKVKTDTSLTKKSKMKENYKTTEIIYLLQKDFKDW